jgi:hypothetical protein
MNITLTREEAQQVLDALRGDSIHAAKQAIETLRARLSAPEPEPVAWMNEGDIGKTDWKVWAHGKPTATIPLYTAPPQREWQGLTDEEVKDIVWNLPYEPSQEHIRAIEAKLKEKNT